MSREPAKVAIFWDKSYLWALIAYRTFRELDIDFELLSGEDIRNGALRDYDILFVPGGWASDKIVALGDEGAAAIRSFVEEGGSYLGFCGGAGLALSHESGLGLTDFGRKPTSVRVPSFSGPVSLRRAAADHPLWKGLPDEAEFHAWWPGQFSLADAKDVTVVATYGPPGEGSFVTDLPVLEQMDWRRWEERYGLNLDPGRIVGEPAVIETRFGKGKILLSYLHFETPGDEAGHRVLLNLIEYLAPGKLPASGAADGKTAAGSAAGTNGDDVEASRNGAAPMSVAVSLAHELKQSVAELIAFGEQNYLWYRRNDWILQWRRGVRGVEYSTLYAMLDQLDRTVTGLHTVGPETGDSLRRLIEISRPFFEEAPRLLRLERDAISRGPISPLKTGDPDIRALREKLFSSSKRCGGLYEEIIELTDAILLPLLRAELEQ